jgi:hypothetical protein
MGLTTPSAAVLRAELGLGAVVAAYSTVVGGAVGLIWQAGAPRVHLGPAINGNEAAAKPLIGDDVHLGLLGIAAGVIVAVIVLLVARDRARGPGAVLGLAVGGVLGALVAARVGNVARHEDMVRALAALIPGVSHSESASLLGYFGFRLRATGLLMMWPIAAVVIHLVDGGLRSAALRRRD